MLTFGQPMAIHYNFRSVKKIRLCVLYSLIFFALVFFFSCSTNKSKQIKILWDKKKAIGLIVPKSLLPDIAPDSLKKLLQINLSGNVDKPGMLGDYSDADEGILFKPLIALTPGETYEINYRYNKISEIAIPKKNSITPQLLKIYPVLDTLPENLLKIYLQFSRPMREGQSAKYIALLNSKKDTVPAVFLDLQPELWNEDRKVLTLWLDPGRIKRDLQPNKRLGNPLKNGGKYIVTISPYWQDAEGTALAKTYTKSFIALNRDSISPNLKNWTIHPAEANTKKPLRITINDNLDYFLLNQAIHLEYSGNTPVKGEMKVSDNGSTIDFLPAGNWRAGRYRLWSETRLEDMAGNNLLRPFDRDLQAKAPKAAQSDIYFEIK